jgi:hypothetical protein
MPDSRNREPGMPRCPSASDTLHLREVKPKEHRPDPTGFTKIKLKPIPIEGMNSGISTRGM